MAARTIRIRRQSGFTLMEITIALAVFLLGVLGFTQTMLGVERAQLAKREAARATQAARGVLERIQAEAFPEAFRRYNGSSADDPGGAGTAPGNQFDVAGLSARSDDPHGRVGAVLFPTPTNAPGTLSEGVSDARWGMPRDLNGDGTVNSAANYASDYRILPVRVVVEWVGAAGQGRVQLDTMLGNY